MICHISVAKGNDPPDVWKPPDGVATGSSHVRRLEPRLQRGRAGERFTGIVGDVTLFDHYCF